MAKQYKTTIIFILLAILITGSIGVLYVLYRRNHSSEAIVIKLNNLSVNFLDGNVIKTNEKEKKFGFSVTNNSNEDIYYGIKVTKINKLGDDATLLFNDKTTIKLEKKDEIDIANSIKIGPNETQSFSLLLNNPHCQKNRFEIMVREEKEEETSITKTIINNNIIKNNSATKPGEEIAVNDEGLISDLDDLGITYYFRGNVSNNYFSFANKMWRIVRINGDNSVRLILDENVEVLTIFSEQKSDLLDTKIYQTLNEWFDANLYNYENYIYNNKYCYDYNLSTDEKTFTSYNRTSVAKLPSFNCESNPYSLKIGLLSIDEAIYAGLLINAENKSNYLYNENIKDWWLLSPAIFDKEKFYPFIVKSDGSINTDINSKIAKTLRPVINISPYVSITGDGTKDNPYKLSDN